MKRSTRLLSLLLAALMLLTAPLANVSTAAADGKTIKEIELSIIPPIAGTQSGLIDVNDMISVPAAAEYHAVAAMWYTQDGMPSKNAEYTFEAGDAYRLGIMLQANDNVNDSFSTEMTPQDVKITGGSLYDIQFQGGGDHLLYLTAMVRPLDMSKLIETVSHTITPPVAGSTSATPPAVTIPSNANYTLTASWNNTADFSFEAGKSYQYRVDVQANDGFAFSEGVKITVNGKLDEETDKYDFDFPYISFYYIASVTAVQPESCTVTFDANGGSGTMDPVSVNKGAEYELPACGFTAPEGKVFDKWDQGAVGEKITVSADTTVKALWKDKPVEKCTVTFDANGGSGNMDAVSVNKGAEYELPACGFTAPEGKEFDCWDKGAVGDKIVINADTEIKAQWKEAAGVSQKYTIETDEYTYVVDHSNTKVTESEAGQQLWVMYSTENLPEGKYIVYNSFVTEPGDLGIGQADSGLTFRMPSQNVKISAVVKARTIGKVDLSEKDEIVITDEMRHGLIQYYLETTKADDFSYPLEMDLNGDSTADLIIGFRDDDSVATRGPGADKVTEPVTLMRQASDLSYDDPYSGFLVTLNKAPEPEPEPEPETCTVTFNANGGSGKMASVTVEKGSEYTLPKCTFTPPYNSTFTKWNLGKAGAKITITADTILKAQWNIVKTNPKLTAKNKSFKIKTKTKKYTVTLKDSKGKAIKGAKLTLKVNNKTYTAKTNSKGKATFKITKLTKKGKFRAVIKYPGNKYFKAISKTVKITVK